MIGSIGFPIWPQLLREERGAVLPVMAVIIIAAVSGAALAVDLARAHALRQQLQLTADAAALAAAINLPDVDAAREAANRYAKRNMPDYADVITADDIDFGHWNADTRQLEPDQQSPSAVKVTPALTAKKGNALDTLFADLLGSHSLDIRASVVAGKRSAMCIQALEPDRSDALGLDFLAKIEALNCTVQVNSRHKWAFRMLAGSNFLASGLCVTGGAYVSFLGRISPEATTGCLPQPDPLADLEAPDISGCSANDTFLHGYHGTIHPGPIAVA